MLGYERRQYIKETYIHEDSFDVFECRSNEMKSNTTKPNVFIDILFNTNFLFIHEEPIKKLTITTLRQL